MTIPQVEGQKLFAPTIAVIAREMDREACDVLPADALPLVSGQFGVTLMEPVEAGILFRTIQPHGLLATATPAISLLLPRAMYML